MAPDPVSPEQIIIPHVFRRNLVVMYRSGLPFCRLGQSSRRGRQELLNAIGESGSNQSVTLEPKIGFLQRCLPAAFVTYKMGVGIEPSANLAFGQAAILGDIRVIVGEKLMFAVQQWPIRALVVGAVRSLEGAHIYAIGPSETWVRIAVKIGIA